MEEKRRWRLSTETRAMVGGMLLGAVLTTIPCVWVLDRQATRSAMILDVTQQVLTITGDTMDMGRERLEQCQALLEPQP